MMLSIDRSRKISLRTPKSKVSAVRRLKILAGTGTAAVLAIASLIPPSVWATEGGLERLDTKAIRRSVSPDMDEIRRVDSTTENVPDWISATGAARSFDYLRQADSEQRCKFVAHLQCWLSAVRSIKRKTEFSAETHKPVSSILPKFNPFDPDAAQIDSKFLKYYENMYDDWEVTKAITGEYWTMASIPFSDQVKFANKWWMTISPTYSKLPEQERKKWIKESLLDGTEIIFRMNDKVRDSEWLDNSPKFADLCRAGHVQEQRIIVEELEKPPEFELPETAPK